MNSRVIVLLVVAVGLLISIFMGVMLGGEDYRRIALFVVPTLAVAGVLLFRTWLPIITIAAVTLVQRPAILFGFGYWELLAGTCVAVALIDTAFRKDPTKRRIGANTTIICATIVLGLLPMHLFASKMGFMNPDGGGLRLSLYAVSVLLFSRMIFSGRITFDHQKWLPILGTIPPLLILMMDLTTFAVPASAGIIQYFYPVNEDAIVGISEGFRLRGSREFGVFFVILVSSYFIAAKRPRSIFFMGMLGALAVGVVCVAISGFRSYFITIFVVTLCVGLMKSRLYLFMITIAGIAMLSGLSLYQEYIDRLPSTIQRAISWFPGSWDTSVVMDGEHSINYRKDLWHMWYQQEFDDVWLLGQGQRADGWDPMAANSHISLLKTKLYSAAVGSEIYRLMLQRNIDAQNLHSGAISTIDHIGIVGLLALIVLIIRVFWLIFLLFKSRQSLEAWEAWIILAFVAKQPYFWATGFFNLDIGPIVMLAVLIEQIHLNHKAAPTPTLTAQSSFPSTARVAQF